jgi:hypothetical protein
MGVLEVALLHFDFFSPKQEITSRVKTFQVMRVMNGAKHDWFLVSEKQDARWLKLKAKFHLLQI